MQAFSRPCMYKVRARWERVAAVSPVNPRARLSVTAVVRLTSASVRSPSQACAMPSSATSNGSNGSGSFARMCARTTLRA